MIDGVVDTAWSGVADAFRENIESGLDDGASLAISVHGRPVIDLWGGADPLSGAPWREDSVTIGFSVSKGVSSIALLQLVERGLVDLDAPVARYWPEYAAAGKETATVREILTHRAGLPAFELDPIEQVLDWELTTATLASQPRQYDTSRYFVYHALSFGFLVGEIVQRVSGLPFGQYLHENITGPLGIDLWIGQPASIEGRYLPSITGDASAEAPVLPDDGVCRAAARAGSQLLPMFRQIDGRPGTEAFNRPEFRAAVLPAGNAVTNGRALARLYAACLGDVDGVRLLGPAIVAEAAIDQAGGIRKPDCTAADPWDAGVQQLWGLGFEISNYEIPMLGEGSFGHSGMGGRLGFAHLGSGVSFGYVSQRMLYPEPPALDPRTVRLLDAVRAVL
ncbi:serine hydrolase domain-containing protein [Herbiconiux sp. 11R-BC]|uniref:serine hydrolase domain-containing protein n=1 Tax=Herbiconiux sp. 11R-BC TaxID=3111637 RepID=UPI003BFBE91E